MPTTILTTLIYFSEAADFFGHTTKEFFNGIDLFEELERSEKRPDIIILDYFMPHADGLETLKRIRTAGFVNIPVVMISGASPINLQREFLNQGANYIISKPVNFKTNQQIVETLSKIDWNTFMFDVEDSVI